MDTNITAFPFLHQVLYYVGLNFFLLDFIYLFIRVGEKQKERDK